MEAAARVQPDYEGPNVRNVLAALLGTRPVDWLPAAVDGARGVVLFVLDGFGWDAATGPGAPTELAAFEGRAITTVVPSTTPAALTSLTTGLPPSQHGVTGYRMRVDDVVLNTIRWQRADGRRAPDPALVQRHQVFAGRPIAVVTKEQFRGSGFTAAHLRDGTFHGWETPAVLVEHVRSLVAAGERFVYAYYSGVDEVADSYGIDGPWYAAELAAAGRLVGAMLDALPDDVALVVTADHGQVQVGPDGWIGLGPLDALVDTYAGDGRFRYLHAGGAAGELHGAAEQLFGTDVWVLTRDQVLDEHWLGPAPMAATRRRVGDVVLAARDGVGFLDPTYPVEAGLLGAHGSVTAAEMQVPLLAARGP